MINLFPGLEHTARHIMRVDHARSNYLNRKEGDGKDKANDWINAHDLKVKDKIMIMIINQK